MGERERREVELATVANPDPTVVMSELEDDGSAETGLGKNILYDAGSCPSRTAGGGWSGGGSRASRTNGHSQRTQIKIEA